MPEIELKNIRKTFDRIVAIDRVDLLVRDGEYLAVIGPSGCGKSTLLKIISGILEPDEGDVLVDGKSILGRPPEERNIGFLLRAIAYGARILLLDEPLSAIDRKVSEEVRVKLRRIVKSKGLTAIHVTHNQEEAMAVADRIAVMRKGRFIQVGTPQELYYQPNTPFVMAFVGDASFFVGRTERGKVVIRGGYELGPSNLPEGDLVVVGVRPENVTFGSGIWGKIRLKSYLGALVRYEIELENGDIIIAITEDEFEEKEVKVWFSDYKLFRFPEEGLSEAIVSG